MIGGRAALRVASTACDDSLVVPARKPRLASTSALAFWPWPAAPAPGTVKLPLAPSIRTVPRPPESSTTALALSVVRTASPARRASSGRAGFQSPPAAGLTSTRPRPGFSSVMTAAVSVVWARAGRAGTRGAASNRSSSSLIARLITSRLLEAQQLVDLDRLAPPLHRHAAPVPNYHPVTQHGQYRAADQNAGAEVAIQPLHAGGQVDGVAQDRVLLLARGAEGAREGGPGCAAPGPSPAGSRTGRTGSAGAGDAPSARPAGRRGCRAGGPGSRASSRRGCRLRSSPRRGRPPGPARPGRATRAAARARAPRSTRTPR